MSSPTTTLRGMTWAHTRGYLPLVATAQRFSELNPNVEIIWEKRSLKDFEEFPVQTLAESFDLLVIDHPFIGYAAHHGIFAPLDDLLPQAFLADQAAQSVGGSHYSYQWDGRQWALAIDAATPVAAWRPDLMDALGLKVPASWPELVDLAKEGHVEVPGAAINCLMNFFGLCIVAGEIPFSSPDRIARRSVQDQSLCWLRQILDLSDSGCLRRNPIQSLNLLSSAENKQAAYCLFPYGYSNYSRDGYAAYPLQFGDLPSMAKGDAPITTTLGGTGLAISSRCKNLQVAADYAKFVAGPKIQRTVYAHAGGQPGHRGAWLDSENNRITRDYFRSTLPALDRAFVRPRHPGYLHGFQEPAGLVLHRYVRDELSAGETIASLDQLWRASQQL